MSITIQTALDVFEKALHETDPDTVKFAAHRLAEVAGYEEEADILRRQANALRNQEWAYDRARDNEL